MSFRLAVNPDTPRTPAVVACIQAEQRREVIFEAIAKLRCGDWEYFEVAFSGKPLDELPTEDQERVLELGATPDEYHLWHATWFAWKSQQREQKPVLLSEFINDFIAQGGNIQRPTAT